MEGLLGEIYLRDGGGQTNRTGERGLTNLACFVQRSRRERVSMCALRGVGTAEEKLRRAARRSGSSRTSARSPLPNVHATVDHGAECAPFGVQALAERG